MPVRKATAEWKGDLTGGTGQVESESGALPPSSYSFSRFGENGGRDTNPEELIAAAHAACFSMAFSNLLAKAGHTPDSVRTEARVHITKGEAGFSISRIDLECKASVPGIEESTFQEQANSAKEGCPVSRALAAVPVHLEASLI